MSNQIIHPNQAEKFLAQTIVLNPSPLKRKRKSTKIIESEKSKHIYHGLDYVTPWENGCDSPRCHEKNQNQTIQKKEIFDFRDSSPSKCIKTFFSQLKRFETEGSYLKEQESPNKKVVFSANKKYSTSIVRTATEPSYQNSYEENLGFGPIFYRKNCNTNFMKGTSINKDKNRKERKRQPGISIFQKKKKQSSKVAVVDLNQTMKDFHEEARKFSENDKKYGNLKGVILSGGDKNLQNGCFWKDSYDSFLKKHSFFQNKLIKKLYHEEAHKQSLKKHPTSHSICQNTPNHRYRTKTRIKTTNSSLKKRTQSQIY